MSDATSPAPTPAPMAQGDGVPGPDPHAANETPEQAAGGTAAAGVAGATPAAPGKPPTEVRVTWAGDRRFDAGRPGGPTVRLDGDARTGPSPVDALVSALAACVSVDVVDILAKRRTPAASLTVDATGERANATPARLVRAELRFRITGAGVERVHAERAIELAVTKYCSVRDSLDPAIPVTWTLELSEQ